MDDIATTIEQAADRWMQAWVKRDRSALEESLAPDFALTVSATPSQRLARAEWLATACTRYLASEFRYRDVQVRQVSDTVAVMSSVAEFRAEIDGMPRNGPLFIVDVWRRADDGRWQVCSRYSSSPEATGSAEKVQGLQEA
jgi:ketosteroid isomerase-like protein